MLKVRVIVQHGDTADTLHAIGESQPLETPFPKVASIDLKTEILTR